jgi:hypothetical protein
MPTNILHTHPRTNQTVYWAGTIQYGLADLSHLYTLTSLHAPQPHRSLRFADCGGVWPNASGSDSSLSDNQSDEQQQRGIPRYRRIQPCAYECHICKKRLWEVRYPELIGLGDFWEFGDFYWNSNYYLRDKGSSICAMICDFVV